MHVSSTRSPCSPFGLLSVHFGMLVCGQTCSRCLSASFTSCSEIQWNDFPVTSRFSSCGSKLDLWQFVSSLRIYVSQSWTRHFTVLGCCFVIPAEFFLVAMMVTKDCGALCQIISRIREVVEVHSFVSSHWIHSILPLGRNASDQWQLSFTAFILLVGFHGLSFIWLLVFLRKSLLLFLSTGNLILISHLA